MKKIIFLILCTLMILTIIPWLVIGLAAGFIWIGLSAGFNLSENLFEGAYEKLERMKNDRRNAEKRL